MRRSKREPEVVMRVGYIIDPESARAAQKILKDGFRRALARAIAERGRKDKREAVS